MSARRNQRFFYDLSCIHSFTVRDNLNYNKNEYRTCFLNLPGEIFGETKGGL